MPHRPIYLDNHATTPVDQQVLEAMLPYFTEHFGNPSSINHAYGWAAEAIVKQSRQTIAEAINATPEEIIFTSGATEANNLAIKGVAEAYFNQGRHIITVVSEHRAVLEPCQYLASLGFEITYLPVNETGLINLNQLEKAIRAETILVSIMTANNEIGVIQPIAEIGAICQAKQVLFHTDAAQAVGKIPVDVQKMQVDLLSLTAHKIYGPKGIGALYIRRRQPRVRIAPQMHGGGQERGLRAGTLCPPQIVGLAEAVKLTTTELTSESARLLHLRARLWSKLKQLPGIYLNGDPEQRLPGNLNISVEGVDGTALFLGIQPIVAVSSGSACSSRRTEPSHVLTALGRTSKLAYASIRFGLGRFTTREEIDTVAEAVISTITALRQSSPSATQK
ncbi:MAG: IscS subfamily cysteine desulfurase [Cyanobacteria bacterium J083]|nr:MAG: IscS subfamily cysteine desulfurase [Cyanobacteria bacterium J083]